jgi:hypothetical protein
MSDPADPKAPDPKTDEDAPTDGKDVFVFYDDKGKVICIVPAEDVLMIVPDELLRSNEPSKPNRPPRTMVWPGDKPETEGEE